MDVPGILLIEKISFGNPTERFDRGRIAYLVRRAGGIVMVACRRGEVLGWVAALPRRRAGTIRGRIYAVAVHPGAREQGLGGQLMRAAMRKLETMGVRRISLEVRAGNGSAVRLYRRLGFVEGERLVDYYGHGRDAVKMVREVRTACDRSA